MCSRHVQRTRQETRQMCVFMGRTPKKFEKIKSNRIPLKEKDKNRTKIETLQKEMAIFVTDQMTKLASGQKCCPFLQNQIKI